jgi:hypothetical protein
MEISLGSVFSTLKIGCTRPWMLRLEKLFFNDSSVSKKREPVLSVEKF